MKRIYTPTKKKTVLIIDNDEIVIQLYREKLGQQGLIVEVANSRAGALGILEQMPIELVLQDLLLPATDGLELLGEIRSRSDKLPIIAFANPYLGKVVRAATTAGASKVLSKAKNIPDEVIGLVRELMGMAGAVVDEEGSERHLVGALLAHAPSMLAKLRTGYLVFARDGERDLHSSELQHMFAGLHAFASAAGQLGFARIAQLASALEALLMELRAKPNKITPTVGRTLGQAIDTLAGLVDSEPHSPMDRSEPPKILVVDDETISRETICSALGKANLVAISVDDSLSAERMLKEERFDLIFLDVEMPGRTGLELCASVRENTANKATPAVFVTAHSDFGTQAQSVLSGGNDFIVKPFLLVELAVKALTWLYRKQQPTTAAESVAVRAEVNELRLANEHAVLNS